MIEFFVPGQPVAKGRPKFQRRGNFVKTYTPEKTVSYENLVRMAAAEVAPEMLWEGAVSVDLDIVCQRPKSLSKKVQHHLKKPDGDNIEKAILDAMNGVIYRSDSQVIAVAWRKRYDVMPGVHVALLEMSQ